MENDRTRRKAIALLLIVFALGCALGAVGMRVWVQRVYGRQLEGRGRHDHAAFVERMTRELALTPEQQKQLQAILEDTRKRYQSIYEQVRPQYDLARQQGRDRIRLILTPEQLPKFEDFVRRIDEERKRKWSEHGER